MICVFWRQAGSKEEHINKFHFYQTKHDAVESFAGAQPIIASWFKRTSCPNPETRAQEARSRISFSFFIVFLEAFQTVRQDEPTVVEVSVFINN